MPYIPGISQPAVWGLEIMKDVSGIPALLSDGSFLGAVLWSSAFAGADPESNPASLLRHDNGVRTAGDSISFNRSFPLTWTRISSMCVVVVLSLVSLKGMKQFEKLTLSGLRATNPMITYSSRSFSRSPEYHPP